MKKLIALLLALIFATPSFAVSCPADKPMEHRGVCEPCDIDIISISQKECAKCSKLRVFENGLCLFKNGQGALYTEAFVFDATDRYAMKTGCYDAQPALTSKSNCSECPNRVYKKGRCIMQGECPKNLVKTENGSCLKCEGFDDNTGWSSYGGVSEKECLKCKGRWYDAQRKACPKSCPGYPENRCPLNCEQLTQERGVFLGEDHTLEQPKFYHSYSRGQRGYCWQCDEPGSVRTAKAECDKCESREYDQKTGICKFKGCPQGYIMTTQGKFCVDPTQGGF